VCSSRPSGFGEAAKTGKLPANLAVEGADEFLTILPDYTATVRPPPKLLTTLVETCCNVLLSHCHRRECCVQCALVER
jgi:hypothetical protein